MSGRRLGICPKASLVAAFAMALTILSVVPAAAATLLRVSWNATSKPDLAGYRLRFGTISGSYGSPINVGRVTSFDLTGLSASGTYYVVVTAYDASGNESGFSNAVSGQPSTVAGPAPTIGSVLELSTRSQYILESGRHSISITGTNFQIGATVNFGPDITAGTASVTGSTQITVTIDVGATAAVGWRTAIVTNPDGGTGSLSQALSVARNADINHDCLVDGGDLNLLALAWNSISTDARYNSAADLDGDGQVDGDDMTIFGEYFGTRLLVCP